ncbi:hypothetical protein [Kitasatospora sp. NPDC001527]|uniref:hypothetical protein n=1 Tax=Kitasatospora sp. NPDC001527 TaxID=3154519 RepID=UPI00332F7A3D
MTVGFGILGPLRVLANGRELDAGPPEAAAATRVLAAMNLRYGAFDFLLSAGTPVFLEVNPDGDWRWAERPTHGTPVTAAVAAMLTTLHHAAVRDLPGAARWRRSGPGRGRCGTG